mmetsp:Transcript_29175/g.78950  ORF Transcript_29175/g.78950 Transcript_29175/m.78950 type:complete len:81 (+) Transcript_29175:2385-2627(+)
MIRFDSTRFDSIRFDSIEFNSIWYNGRGTNQSDCCIDGTSRNGLFRIDGGRSHEKVSTDFFLCVWINTQLCVCLHSEGAV